MERSVVFIHIPKTAGSSLRSALAAKLQPHELLSVYPRAEWATPAKAIGALPEEQRRGAKLVFGHFSYGLHREFPQECTYATVVRDPVERVLSAYYHEVRGIERRSKDGKPLTRWQRAIAESDLSAVEYARGRPQGVAVAHTQNLQTRMLAGKPHIDGDPEHPDLLDLAMDHLGDFGAVGTTEAVGDFAVALARGTGWSRELSIPELNQNPGRPRAESLPPTDVAEMTERNSLDAALFESIQQRIAAGNAVTFSPDTT